MKRRITALFLSLAILYALLPSNLLVTRASELSGSCGENLTWIFDESSGVLTISGEGKMTNWDLPRNIPWYQLCSRIISVKIEPGVTSIGWGAFYNCSSLTDVDIAKSVEIIGESSFSGCTALTEINLKVGLTKIERFSFFNCNSLDNIIIPESVKSVGEFAFCGTVPDQKFSNQWEKNEFYIGSWLINVSPRIEGEYSIINGTTGIAGGAANSLNGLTAVSIPDSVKYIGRSAFFGCENLNKVLISESISIIEDYAFSNCKNLQCVCFCGNAPSIGDNVFKIRENSGDYVNIPGLTLYYYEGMEGWTTPEWNGYPTAIRTPKHEHSYTATVMPPTCTEQGYTTYTCEGCDDTYVDTYVDALGHAWDEGKVTVKPTGTEPGEMLYSCTRCDATRTEVIPATGEDSKIEEFTDVPENAWYVEAVEYAVSNGLMKGVSEDKFEPEETMTRAMLVTVLWRYEGEPEAGTNPFTDVPDGLWYTDAVAWAAGNGIVGGVGNNQFEPEGKITREQMATILYRYGEKHGIDTSKRSDLSGFPDGGETSSWAKDAVQWAVAEGIINGSDGKLLPQGNATRAQVAAILMRFVENIVKN